jgi:hypothetical protein
MQAGFKADQVQVVGHFSDYARISDEADRKEHVFHFCPDCGSQVFYTEPSEPDLVVVSVGSFGDPSFPPPRALPAGRTAGAIEHLREAIEMWEGFGGLAYADSDLDPIRNEPGFRELIGR